MKFEKSDIKTIMLYDDLTCNKIEFDIADHLEIKTNVQAKIPVELLKQIDSQRLNCRLMGAGIIGLTLSFNCIVRAELNDFLDESFTLDQLYQNGEYNGLPYSIECKNPLVEKVEYDDGQPELESEELLLDFAEVFNEVPSLYSELVSNDRYYIIIKLAG